MKMPSFASVNHGCIAFLLDFAFGDSPTVSADAFDGFVSTDLLFEIFTVFILYL